MEIENENYFIPESLYEDEVDDIMGFLSVNPSNLIGQIAGDFQDAIYKHIERMRVTDKFRLPSFGEGFEWLNTSSSLSFDDLRNKIYIMDFFTYCCINCIHILPYLKRVEEFYAQNPGIAVVGIHSPKFPNEKDLNRVKEAVIRNNIQHPVLNDSECKLWKMYGVSCWPTVFIVGPAHTLLFVLVGETQIDKLFFLCCHVVNYFQSCQVELDSHPIPVLQMKTSSNDKIMLFPENVSTSGNHIIVSDTGHNRLLWMSRLFELEETIGSGCRGSNDGPFNSASFNSPHGTVWYKDSLYVADTGNNSIRKVCFNSKFVTTVFSKKFYESNTSCISSTTKVDFHSPWDVCVGPKLDSDLTTLNVLYIAVAGSHQIWALDLEAYDTFGHGICVPFAGSGKEENRQNLYRFKAGFAQPSGIAYSSLSPDHLFIADSESSTIKSIALKGGTVQIIVGGGQDPSDLFKFGDQDGNHINVKLQHPMNVCVIKDQVLAITDTYNHKIKLVNVKEKECITYNTDVDLCEPSGICLIDEILLVADTNNHRIVQIPLSEDKISNVIPVHFDEVIETFNCSPQDDSITSIPLDCEGKLFCHFQLNTSSKYEFNKHGSQIWDVSFKGDGKLSVMHKNKNMFGDVQPSLILQTASDVKENSNENSSSEVTVTGTLQLCDKILKVCCSKEITFKIIVMFSKLGGLKLVCLNLNAFID